MYVEFVCPPDSSEVLVGVDMDSVPRVADRVYIKKVNYRVYSVEWVYLEGAKACNPLVNLIVDEIEEQVKKKKK